MIANIRKEAFIDYYYSYVLSCQAKNSKVAVTIAANKEGTVVIAATSASAISSRADSSIIIAEEVTKQIM